MLFSLRKNDIVLLKTCHNRSDLPLVWLLKLYPDQDSIIRMGNIMVKVQKLLRMINN